MPAPKKNRGGAPKGNQNAIGNKGGAPVLYSKEWIENEAKLLLDWFQEPRNIWLKGFALLRGYDPSRFDEFSNKSIEFSLALKKAKQWQEYKLVDMSLFNEINPTITKFALTNNHGWAEKQQISGDTANPLSFILQKGDGDSKDLVNGNGN